MEISILALRILAIAVVGRFDTVHGQTDQEMVLRKKATPFLIQHIAVCLQRMGNLHIFCIIFLLQPYALPEKIQPRQRRLAALKGDSTASLCKGKRLPDNIVQRLGTHDSVRRLTPVFHLVGVKAVTAAHIAKPRCGLYHHMYCRHQIYFSTIAFISFHFASMSATSLNCVLARSRL